MRIPITLVTIIIVVSCLLMLMLSGWPPRPAGATEGVFAPGQSELRLQPIAPDLWFQLSTGDYSGTQFVNVVVEGGHANVLRAEFVHLDCNPQANVGILRQTGPGKVELTYPAPRTDTTRGGSRTVGSESPPNGVPREHSRNV